MIATFGEVVRRRRMGVKLQQAELAEKVGVTASYISLLESGKRPAPSDEVTGRMEEALGMTPGELVRLAHLERTPADIRAELDLDRKYAEGMAREKGRSAEGATGKTGGIRSIPLINKVAAGYPADFTDKGYPVGIADEYVSIPDIEDAHAFAVTVVGDSMEPRLHEGDVVIISPAETVSNGDICFVRIDDNGDTTSTIKQVWHDDEEHVRLEGFNPRYPSRIVEKERIGGVYRAVRRLEKL